MKVNLADLNLNLLVALDVLLKEQNVTRAGEKLNITQSAMSNILRQLRRVFKDELFVRGLASKMIPTVFALSLRKPLSAFLEQAEVVISTVYDFNPETSRKVFRLGMSDYCEAIFLPKLIEYMAEHAPHIILDIKHINSLESMDPFELGEVDLAIGVFDHLFDGLKSHLLFEDEFVVVGAVHNKAMQTTLNLKSFKGMSKVVAAAFLKNLSGLNLDPVVEVGHAMSAALMVRDADEDFIAIVPNGAVNYFARKEFFKIQKPPFKIAPAKVLQVWHKRTTEDAAQKWMRSVMKQLSV